MVKITKFIISVLILYIFLNVVDRYFLFTIVNYDTGKAQVIMRMRNQNFDYVMLGSSRTEDFFNIEIIDSLIGLHGYNFGLDGAEFAESYVLLDRFLKTGNHIKKIFIQVDRIQMQDSYSYPFHEFRYLSYLGDKDLDDVVIDKRGYLKYYLWRYIPLTRYAEFNTNFNVISILSRYKYFPHDYTSLGFRYIPVEEHKNSFFDVRYEGIESDNSPFEPNQAQLFYLNKIVQLAKENDIEPIFLQSPVYYKIEDFASKFSLSNTANVYSVRYLDYLSSSISKDDKYFRDYTHLNGKGATFYSTSIAEDIKFMVKGK